MARPKQKYDKRAPEALGDAIDHVWEPRRSPLFGVLDLSREIDAERERLFAEEGARPPRTAEEAQHYIERLHRIEAPLWDALEEVERRRNQQDSSDRLPFGQIAIERLRLLRGERQQIADLHGEGSAAYKAFMREHFVREYNLMSTTDRLCERCFGQFALTDPRARFCSDNCSSANRNRERQHDGLSVARREAKLKAKVAAAVEEHVKGCRFCVAGEPCETNARFFGSQSVYAHPWSSEALEAAAARADQFSRRSLTGKRRPASK